MIALAWISGSVAFATIVALVIRRLRTIREREEERQRMLERLYRRRGE
jgi:hypothetical protein